MGDAVGLDVREGRRLAGEVVVLLSLEEIRGVRVCLERFREPIPGGDEEDEEEEFVEDEGEVGEFGDALMEADEAETEE